MFERRLKTLLFVMVLLTLALAGRAAWIQIVQKDWWTQEAVKVLTQQKYIETTRGKILDVRGAILAEDQPCIDACVEYPAITEDWEVYKQWLHDHALAEVTRRYGETYTKAKLADRQKMLTAQTAIVRDQVQDLWIKLAEVSGEPLSEIEQTRSSIIDTVEVNRQHIWLRNYQNALKKAMSAAATTQPWYTHWLPGGGTAPGLDDFAVNIAAQSEAHVILGGIDTAVYNALAKDAENLPGLVLQPGHRRVYPFGEAACHIVGHMAKVNAERITSDPNQNDPLRRYLPSELAGNFGVESLCEQTLRGTRGQESDSGSVDEATIDPVPGRDVRLTIDMRLQAEIEQAFAERREFYDPQTHDLSSVRQNQPGAAVVIDLPTGQVRALVSYPLFDPNTLDADYAKLSVDDARLPLMNRATEQIAEPGSTVKPMMGLGALADGLITPQTTIECNGYLVLDGHQYDVGKCWTVREFGYLIGTPDDPRHHQIPADDKHPTGFLTVTDAIERSCNVFFETVADHMKMARQRYWYDRFGLGRPTGIGLREESGRIPDPAHVSPLVLREQTWFAGIGQGDILATPLQMANVAATIARDGVWMRPKLLDPAPPTTQPDRVDMGFSPDALHAVKEGMWAVVNKLAGTAKISSDGLDGITIAGKTGTPQVQPLRVPQRDEQGKLVLVNGHENWLLVDPHDPRVNTWYIGSSSGPDKAKTDYAHAWFIGYAPADHPQVAIAVFVEYGGDGGPVAGRIAHDVLAACVKYGYLKK
jgi:penicillin-binding protein 2